MNAQLSGIPDLNSLVTLFSRNMSDVGAFEEVVADRLPPFYRGLLDHNEHMTVKLESAWGCRVTVEVKRRRLTRHLYERKSVLREARGGRTLQYNVVRMHTAFLDESVREEIESEQIPLGRILIRHHVLRRVQRAAFWQVTPGPELRAVFGLDRSIITFGRTALIFCDGDPAVELLEILAPQTQ